MKIVDVKSDDATPPYTTFTVEAGDEAHSLYTRLLLLLGDDLVVDAEQVGRRFTVTVSDFSEMKKRLLASNNPRFVTLHDRLPR